MKNPVLDFLKEYKFSTPDDSYKKFCSVVKAILPKVENIDLEQEKFNESIILLKKMLKKPNDPNSINELYIGISEILESEFYDIATCNIEINKKKLPSDFEDTFKLYWKVLNKAKVIAQWWNYTVEEVAIEDVAFYAYEAYSIINNEEAKAGLLNIAILGECFMAIEGMDEEQVEEEKTKAKEQLIKLSKSKPNLAKMIGQVINELV